MCVSVVGCGRSPRGGGSFAEPSRRKRRRSPSHGKQWGKINLGQWFPNLSTCQHHSGGCLNRARPPPVSLTRGLRDGPRTHMSNEPPVTLILLIDPPTEGGLQAQPAYPCNLMSGPFEDPAFSGHPSRGLLGRKKTVSCDCLPSGVPQS